MDGLGRRPATVRCARAALTPAPAASIAGTGPGRGQRFLEGQHVSGRRLRVGLRLQRRCAGASGQHGRHDALHCYAPDGCRTGDLARPRGGVRLAESQRPGDLMRGKRRLRGRCIGAGHAGEPADGVGRHGRGHVVIVAVGMAVRVVLVGVRRTSSQSPATCAAIRSVISAQPDPAACAAPPQAVTTSMRRASTGNASRPFLSPSALVVTPYGRPPLTLSNRPAH